MLSDIPFKKLLFQWEQKATENIAQYKGSEEKHKRLC